MRKIIALSLVAISILVILGLIYKSPKKPSQALNTMQQATIVEVAKPEEKIIPQQIETYANTESIDSIQISAEIAGKIAKISFKPGQFVKANTPLIELDNTLYKNELTLARSNEKLSLLDLARIKTLNAKNLSANQELDNAKAKALEKTSLRQSKEDLVKKTKLTAPFDGVLGEKKISIGEYVSPGQALLAIDAINPIKVRYHLPEATLAYLHVGQEVSLTTEAFSNKTFVGYVSYISPTINTSNHMLTLEATIKNPDRLLLAGLFVHVSQKLNRAEKVLLVPEEALIPTIEGQTVFVIEENKAKAVLVTTGKHLGAKVLIHKGLKATDKIVIRGQHKLKDGALIKAKG